MTQIHEFNFKTIQLALIDGNLHHMTIKACPSCKAREYQPSIHLITKVQKYIDRHKELGRDVKIIYMPFICLNTERG